MLRVAYILVSCGDAHLLRTSPPQIMWSVILGSIERIPCAAWLRGHWPSLGGSLTDQEEGPTF